MTVIVGLIPVSLQASSRHQVSKKWHLKGRARKTFNQGDLLLENLFKLSFRNPIPVEEDALRSRVGLFLLEICSVVDELCNHVLQDNKSLKCHDYKHSANVVTLVISFMSSTISTRDS